MTYITRLPKISNGPAVPIGGADGISQQAKDVLTLMRVHKDQRRRVLTWDPFLAEVAMMRCQNQAWNGWDGHEDPQGNGPHWWIRQHSPYKLEQYGEDPTVNYVESVANSGDGTVSGQYGVWASWMGSPGHRYHLLGLERTYEVQTQVGIAYFYDPKSIHWHYWSVITVPPEGR